VQTACQCVQEDGCCHEHLGDEDSTRCLLALPSSERLRTTGAVDGMGWQDVVPLDGVEGAASWTCAAANNTMVSR
jgi:hypothetical protein